MPSRAGHYLTDPSKEPDPAKCQADMAYLTNHGNAHTAAVLRKFKLVPDQRKAHADLEFCAHEAPAGVGIDPVDDGERRSRAGR